MDEQMIEQIAREIDRAAGYDMPRDDAVAAARAIAGLMAGKVAEMTTERDALRDAVAALAHPKGME
jgi:hypothetical protein